MTGQTVGGSRCGSLLHERHRQPFGSVALDGPCKKSRHSQPAKDEGGASGKSKVRGEKEGEEGEERAKHQRGRDVYDATASCSLGCKTWRAKYVAKRENGIAMQFCPSVANLHCCGSSPCRCSRSFLTAVKVSPQIWHT
jgi:hypothetical protein